MTAPDTPDGPPGFWERVFDPGHAPGGSASDAFRQAVGASWIGTLLRGLVVIVGTFGLVLLGVVLVVAGLLGLFGVGPGQVARLTPPGRAGSLVEFAVKG